MAPVQPPHPHGHGQIEPRVTGFQTEILDRGDLERQAGHIAGSRPGKADRCCRPVDPGNSAALTPPRTRR
jgi:hypothetical protein